MADNFTCEFFRDLYATDFDRRDKHDAADSFLLAITTLLGTIGFYCLKFLATNLAWEVIPSLVAALFAGYRFCRHKRFAWSDFVWLALFATIPTVVVYLAYNGVRDAADFLDMWFLTFFGAFLGFFVLSIVSILGSVWPRDIAYISEPAALNEWLVNLQPFYGYGNQDRQAIADMEERELNDEMRQQYVRCSQLNREHNLIKQKWQSTGRTAMALAVSAILLNGLPIYYKQAHHRDIQRVEVVKFSASQAPAGPDGDSSNAEGAVETEQDPKSGSSIKKAGAAQDRGVEAKQGPAE